MLNNKASIAAETQAAIDFDDRARAEFGRYFCRRCAEQERLRAACERFSMGCYAGMYCDECWAEDGRNHDRQFDEADAGEHYDETDAY